MGKSISVTNFFKNGNLDKKRKALSSDTCLITDDRLIAISLPCDSQVQYRKSNPILKHLLRILLPSSPTSL